MPLRALNGENGLEAYAGSVTRDSHVKKLAIAGTRTVVETDYS